MESSSVPGTPLKVPTPDLSRAPTSSEPFRAAVPLDSSSARSPDVGTGGPWLVASTQRCAYDGCAFRGSRQELADHMREEHPAATHASHEDHLSASPSSSPSLSPRRLSGQPSPMRLSSQGPSSQPLSLLAGLPQPASPASSGQVSSDLGLGYDFEDEPDSGVARGPTGTQMVSPSSEARRASARAEVIVIDEPLAVFAAPARSPPQQRPVANPVHDSLMELALLRKAPVAAASRRVRFSDDGDGHVSDPRPPAINVDSESVAEVPPPPPPPLSRVAVGDDKGKEEMYPSPPRAAAPPSAAAAAAPSPRRPPVLVVIDDEPAPPKGRKRTARAQRTNHDPSDSGDDGPEWDAEAPSPPEEPLTDSQLLGLEGSSRSVRRRRETLASSAVASTAGRSVSAQIAALAEEAKRGATSPSALQRRLGAASRTTSPQARSKLVKRVAPASEDLSGSVVVIASPVERPTAAKRSKAPSPPIVAPDSPQSPELPTSTSREPSREPSPDPASPPPAVAVNRAPDPSPEATARALLSWAARPASPEHAALEQVASVDMLLDYSMIGEYVEGNDIVYDLSQQPQQMQEEVAPEEQDGERDHAADTQPIKADPEPFKTPSPRLKPRKAPEPPATRPSPAKRGRPVKREAAPQPREEDPDAPLEQQSYVGDVDTPRDVLSVDSSGAAQPNATKRARAELPAAAAGATWRRGRVNGHAVLYAEPPNAKKLFAGFRFLVTGCKVVNELDDPSKHIQYLVKVGQGETRVQLSEWIHDVVTFQGGRELFYRTSNRDNEIELTQRLSASMGPVAGTPFDRNIICISEKPHRTIKWMLAAAAGVPCVKWKWLHECIRHGKLMDYRPFLLPLGRSTVTGGPVPFSPRPLMCPLLFDGMKIELHGAADWRSAWTPVLKEQGAEVVERIGVGNERALDLIVSEEDPDYPRDVFVAKARQLRIALVSKEWVIQCVFNGARLPTRDFLAQRQIL